MSLDRKYSKYQKLDKGGWEELKIVKNHIKGDIYTYFIYESNNGDFDYMSGHELIKWYEKMRFSKIIKSNKIGIYGVPERSTFGSPEDNSEYECYKNAVKKEFVNFMESKYNGMCL